MGDWWSTRNIGLASLVLGLVGIGVSIWPSNQGNSITQNIQNQTINNGLMLEQYEQGLKRRETEVRTELEDAHAEDRSVLELELSDIQQQLQNTTASYETHIASLIERIAQLEKLRGELPDKLLDQAIKALREGKNEKADRLFQQTGEEAEGHIKRAAVAAFHRGRIAEDDFRYKDALQFYEDNVRLQPDNRDGWIFLGNLYHRLGELTKAESAYNTVLKLAGTNQENEEAAYSGLGAVHQTRGDLDKVIEFNKKSLTINIELSSKQGMARNYGNLMGVYQTRGDLDKAIEFYEKALVIDIKMGNKEGMASDYGNLGNVYQTRDDLDKAIELYEKSLVINQELGRKEGVAIQYNNLGRVHRIRGELGKTIEFHEKALAIFKELSSKEGMANQYGNLGRVYQARGKLGKAIEFYKKSLALFKEIDAKREITQTQSLLDEVHQIQTAPGTVD